MSPHSMDMTIRTFVNETESARTIFSLKVSSPDIGRTIHHKFPPGKIWPDANIPVVFFPKWFCCVFEETSAQD